MSETIDHRRFIELLTGRFPEVAASIDDCDEGLLHLEMATLARATQAAIDAREWKTVRRHFAFVDEAFRAADEYVENAVYVSYLENLSDGGLKAGAEARGKLPPALAQALVDYEAYMEELSRRSRGLQ